MFRQLVLRVFLNQKIKSWLEGSRVFGKLLNRFVAGSNLDAAVLVTKNLNAKGLSATFDFLGERASSIDKACLAQDEYRRILLEISFLGLDANVSIKISQFGLIFAPTFGRIQTRALAQMARRGGNFVRFDMEDSSLTDTTIELYRELACEDLPVGLVLQAYLKRTGDDIFALNDGFQNIRLCKGAYKEPREIVFAKKREVDANYIFLARGLLNLAARGLAYPAFATHDKKIIEGIKAKAEADHIPKTSFEFQMLYGIREKLAEELSSEGYRVRIYVPYGTEAYPYFVRRLAERPANIIFLLKNLFR